MLPTSWQLCPGTCFEYLAPYRVSFGVVLYHLFFCLFTVGITTGMWYRARFHNGCVCDLVPWGGSTRILTRCSRPRDTGGGPSSLSCLWA
jgi:hypothetical protein